MKLPPAPVIRYGAHPDQVANLHVPASGAGPWPTVVLIHGGFWRERWDRTLMTPLAHDLATRGYAAWNVEYRRVGQEGGGYPGTLDDVAAAVDALADVAEIDPKRVVVLGHSAGGHLALWLAARLDSRVHMRGVVALAAVSNFARAHADALGGGAVADFLGAGPGFEERVRAASPTERIPTVPQLLVHGGDDDIVPPSQSRAYAELARGAGVAVELLELDGADHFDVVDVRHEAWQVVVEVLPGLFATPS
jgi:acetyl esterase/lipase